MFINKLNQLYKPKRILYYIEADDDINSFYRGTVPDALKQYANTFGTYDSPGVFFVRSFEKPVIGIEFRLDDHKIEYPTSLKSVVLDQTFFIR